MREKVREHHLVHEVSQPRGFRRDVWNDDLMQIEKRAGRSQACSSPPYLELFLLCKNEYPILPQCLVLPADFWTKTRRLNEVACDNASRRVLTPG
jgi:hypothetical protein